MTTKQFLKILLLYVNIINWLTIFIITKKMLPSLRMNEVGLQNLQLAVYKQSL